MPGYPQGFFRLPELEATQRDLLLKLQNDLYKHPLKSPDQRDAILKHLQETYTKAYPELEPGLLGKLFSDVTDDYLLLQCDKYIPYAAVLPYFLPYPEGSGGN